MRRVLAWWWTSAFLQLAVVCAGVVALETRTAAAGSASGAVEGLSNHLSESPQLLNDPAGVRSWLEGYGVGLQLYYNYQFGMKLRGGVRPENAYRNSGSYDFLTRVDVEELASWPGLELLLHVKGNHGENVNPDVGALSNPIDDADGYFPVYVAQLWAQQGILSDRVRLRLGYLDQQTILDRNAFANSEDRQFLATALDNNPLVPLRIGLGATLFADPLPWLTVTVGTADADNIPLQAGFDTAFDTAESLMAYIELGGRVHFGDGEGALPGNYRIGGFYDATERDVFGPVDPGTGELTRERGSGGVYASFDQLVHRERSGSNEGLGLFARFGWADGKVNRASLFWSLGLHYLGLVPGRGDDVLGIGMYQLRGSSPYREYVDTRFGNETGLEVYYRAPLLPWLEVTPDFQYIADPGGHSSTEDAIILALRMRVSF
jgi:porin